MVSAQARELLEKRNHKRVRKSEIQTPHPVRVVRGVTQGLVFCLECHYCHGEFWKKQTGDGAITNQHMLA